MGSATSIFAFQPQASDKAKEVLQPPPLVADSKEDSSSPSEQLKVAGGDNTHNIPTTITTSSTREELRREPNKLIVEDASPDDEDEDPHPLLSTTNGEGEKTTTTTAKDEEDSPGGTKTKSSSFFASMGTQGSPTRSKHIFFPDDPAVPLTSTTTTTTSPLRTSTTATAPEFIPLGSRTTKAGGGSEDKRPGSKEEAKVDQIMAHIEALMEREGELDEGEEDDDIEPLDPDDLDSYDWNKDSAYGGKESKGKGGLVGYKDEDEDDDDDDDTNDEDGEDYDTGGKGSSSDEDPGDSFFVSKGKDKPLFWQDKTGGDGDLGDLVRAAETRGREPFGGGGGEKASASIDAGGGVPSFPSFSPAGTGGGPSSIFGATPFPSFGATTATTTTSEAGGAAPSTLAFPFGATTTPTPTADSAGSSPFSFNFQPSTDTPAFSLGDAHWPSGRRPASGRGRGSRRI